MLAFIFLRFNCILMIFKILLLHAAFRTARGLDSICISLSKCINSLLVLVGKKNSNLCVYLYYYRVQVTTVIWQSPATFIIMSTKE